MPTTPVQIYGFNGQLVKTTRFQLLQWKHGLSIEMQTNMSLSGGRTVASHLRKLLETPKGYPIENIYAHLVASIDDIDGQFESGDFNYEDSLCES